MQLPTTYGHLVEANYAFSREICGFLPFLNVSSQHRHRTRNLHKILIYLKKKSNKNGPFSPILHRHTFGRLVNEQCLERNFLSLGYRVFLKEKFFIVYFCELKLPESEKVIISIMCDSNSWLTAPLWGRGGDSVIIPTGGDDHRIPTPSPQGGGQP